MAILLWLVPQRIWDTTGGCIPVFRYYQTWPRDRGSSSLELYLPTCPFWMHLIHLHGHSDLLLTLRVFVGKRGLTCKQNIPLTATNPSDCLSSSGCNLMRRRLIHLLPLAHGAQRSPLIYSANRIWSDGWLRHIRYYKISCNESVHWCWDKTTQVASDDEPFQRCGWRGVLSLFFKVRACQGRVTMLLESLRGVSAPNTSSPLRSGRPEYSMSTIGSNFLLKLHIVGVKITGVGLSIYGKPFYVTQPRSGPASPGIFYETFPPLPACSSYLRVVPKYCHPSRSPLDFTKYRSLCIGLFLP